MDDKRFQIRCRMEDISTADCLAEAVRYIKKSVAMALDPTETIRQLNVDDKIDDIVEEIDELFVIEDVESGEKYDGDGWPISGKFVISNPQRGIRKELNVQTLQEAIEYVYDVAEKEYEWLSMASDDVDIDILNDYSILNKKTGRSYSPINFDC